MKFFEMRASAAPIGHPCTPSDYRRIAILSSVGMLLNFTSIIAIFAQSRKPGVQSSGKPLFPETKNNPIA
jgi:hypothetical protein